MALSLALDLTIPAPPGSFVSISTPADLKAELTDEEYVTFCEAARTKGGFADKWFKLTPDEEASLAAPPLCDAAGALGTARLALRASSLDRRGARRRRPNPNLGS